MSFLSTLPQKLSRVTSGGRFIGEIDGLRFLAIFPVLVQHLSERLQRYGNADFENVKEKASYITPVPGGVGPMTIASLLLNTLKAATSKDTITTVI